MKRAPQYLQNKSLCLEGRLANAVQLSHHGFQGVVRTVSEMARICPDLSGNVRKCPDLSGSVHGVSRTVRPRSGPVPRLVPQILAGPRRCYPPSPPHAFPLNTADTGPPYPSENCGPQKIKSTPSQNQPTIPSSHQKNIARPDTHLTGRTVERPEGRPRERSQDTVRGKDKQLRPDLRDSRSAPNNQYTDIHQTRARRRSTLSSSSVVAISYSAISPASLFGA